MLINNKSLMVLKITCPKCNYTPVQCDQWVCNCGNIWNTFKTAGRCKCGKQWKNTCCPCCGKWSMHFSWYPQLSDLFEREMKNINPNVNINETNNEN